jgi:hypothetical protein
VNIPKCFNITEDEFKSILANSTVSRDQVFSEVNNTAPEENSSCLGNKAELAFMYPDSSINFLEVDGNYILLVSVMFVAVPARTTQDKLVVACVLERLLCHQQLGQ